MEEPLDKLVSELLAAQEGGEAGTRGRITRAAMELFAEKSYDGTTTKAIAERAGVTEKTLFRHFPSKDEIFKHTVYPALFRLLEPIAVSKLREVLQAREGGFRETVRAIVAERVAFGVKHPAIVKMVVQEMWLRPAFREVMIAFFMERMWSTVSAVFDEARARGEMRDVPSPVALRTVVSLIGGYLLSRTVLFPGGAWDDARAVDELTTLILDGLAAS